MASLESSTVHLGKNESEKGNDVFILPWKCLDIKDAPRTHVKIMDLKINEKQN